MDATAKRRLVLATILSLLSCQERVVEPADVVRVEVEPAVLSVPVGAESRFQASLFDDRDNPLTGRAIAWSVEDASVGTVADGGAVTGRSVGETLVYAEASGRIGTATLRVTSNIVGSIEVVPSDAVVEFGGSREFGAIVRATDGTTLEGRVPSWSTATPGVATVDPEGMLTGVGLGTTRLVASLDGVAGEALVAVVAPTLAAFRVEPPSLALQVGAQARLTALGQKPDGALVQGLPAAWRSLDAAVATVDEAGLVTAVSEGQTRVEAGFGRFLEGSTITVTPVPAAAIDVRPDAPTVFVGDTLRLQATVRAADGTVLDRAPVWSSTDATTADVDDGGLVTARAEGVAFVVARLDGVRDSARVRVEARPIAAVRVRPSESTLRVGDIVRLDADVLAADGTLLDRPVEWTSTDAGVARVNGSGVVTALATGTALIRATAGGVSGTATVHVNPPPIVALEVVPATLTLETGESGALSVTGRTAGGAQRAVAGATWATGDAGVATVSANGTVTAVQPGTTTITATAEGRTGQATVTVVRPPIVSLRVDPSTVVLLTGGQATLHAVGVTAAGEEVTDLSVSWRSSNGAVAAVSSAGRVTALQAGSARITASAEGVEGEAGVTVQSPTGPTRIDIVGGGFSLAVGESRQVSAVLRDADGEAFSAQISWTTIVPAIATVSFTGLVRAQAPGATYVVAYYKELRDSVRVTVTAAGGALDAHAAAPLRAVTRRTAEEHRETVRRQEP